MVAVLVLLVGAGAFFGGMKYQQTQAAGNNSRSGQATQDVENQNGQGHPGGPEGFNGNGRGGATRGEIISQDDNSITVKLEDGSSKIVILSNNTTINKTSSGTQSDLKTGERVSVFGTNNSDGSVTAQNISIGGGMFRNGQDDEDRPNPSQ